MKKENWLLFIILSLLWGSNWAVMKIGLEFARPLFYGGVRLLLGALFLSIPVLMLSRGISDFRVRLKPMILVSIIFSIHYSAVVVGLHQISSGITAVLTYTSPLFVVVLAAALLGERATIPKTLGVLLGFAGVYLVGSRVDPEVGGFSIPDAIILLGAFSWALATVYYKGRLKEVNPAAVNLFQVSIAGSLMLGIGLLSEPHPYVLKIELLTSLLYASILGTSIGTTLWLYLVRNEEASEVSAYSFVIPIFAFIFGWLLLGETIDIRQILGSTLILVGIFLVNRRSVRAIDRKVHHQM